MLSVIIPAFNEAEKITQVVTDWLESGVVGEVIIADGSSQDGTAKLARAAGARVVTRPRSRGGQMAAGAQAAVGNWLLFVHADTNLSHGWQVVVQNFMSNMKNHYRAAYFRLTIDDPKPLARRLEGLVAWRCRIFGLPYGDQGLLMSAAFYEHLGGFPMIPLMEDVALVRRIANHRLQALPINAITSSARYKREGYLLRSGRNLICLMLYFLGVSPAALVSFYEGGNR